MSNIGNSNIGAEAATAVDQKIQEFRTLQEELMKHRTDLGTLMAQRNENEMVKQELEVCEREVGRVVGCIEIYSCRVTLFPLFSVLVCIC